MITRRMILWATLTIEAAACAALIAMCTPASAHAATGGPLGPVSTAVTVLLAIALALLVVGLVLVPLVAWVIGDVDDYERERMRGVNRRLSSVLMPVIVLCLLLLWLMPAHAATKDTPVCDWNKPGTAVYTGRWDTAIDSYTQIPTEVRKRLKYRALAGQYDDVVLIKRDTITGKAGTYGALSYMHSGKASRCVAVDRSRWADTHAETALVFCSEGWCIARPAVCNNWSILGAPVALAAPTPAIPAPGTTNVVEVAPSPSPAIPTAPAPVESVALPGPAQAGSFAETAEGNGLGWFALAALGLLLGGARLAGGGGPTFLPLPLPTHIPGVPEASTWAMLLAGLAVVVYLAGRHKARATPQRDALPAPGRPKRTEPSWSVLNTPGVYQGAATHMARVKGTATRPGGAR